jgi:hypothetical protein
MPHADLGLLTGDARPLIFRIRDDDPSAYAVGDVVIDSGQLLDGVPIASIWRPQPPGRSLLWSVWNSCGVIVGIGPTPPANPKLGDSPPVIQPGVRPSPAFVWVLRAGDNTFDIVGDSTMPARSEQPFPAVGQGGVPYNLSTQAIDEGGFRASTVYQPPPGPTGRSRVALAGATFNLNQGGELAVVGMAPDQQLAPGALYRVKLRS